MEVLLVAVFVGAEAVGAPAEAATAAAADEAAARAAAIAAADEDCCGKTTAISRVVPQFVALFIFVAAAADEADPFNGLLALMLLLLL